MTIDKFKLKGGRSTAFAVQWPAIGNWRFLGHLCSGDKMQSEEMFHGNS